MEKSFILPEGVDRVAGTERSGIDGGTGPVVDGIEKVI